uniref:Sorting nexin 29 n=2 Tax=Monodelphis domestica TaxID=13616 RepID=F6XJ52_MONDO
IVGSQSNDTKRQFLLGRLLDAVKQCQIRFGGRKEIASDSDSRVTCLCAQFESVLQHGLKRSRGLALTAAAIKQAAGFSSKTETEPVFWYYVKEVLNKHELQRFYSLRNISTDVGRGRAWLRCALNEHSLERYIHMLLADKIRLSIFYEDWAFVMDEERSSMLPTMAAGLNSILFAINIDNKDLNGQSKYTVSDLLKESTQNVTSLLKVSTQGILREITASPAVSILIKPDQESDPLPVVARNVNADAKCKKDRKKKKKVTNIISFDDEEDEQNSGDIFKKTGGTGESSEENSDRSSVNIISTFESPFGQNSNGSQSSNSWKNDSMSFNGEYGYQKLDVKSIDDEDIDENEDEVYGKSVGQKNIEDHKEVSEKPLDGNTCLSQMHSWAPLQVLHGDSDVLFPLSGVGSYAPADATLNNLENGSGPQSSILTGPELQYSVEASPPVQGSPLSSLLPSTPVPESMTISNSNSALGSMGTLLLMSECIVSSSPRSLRNLLDGEMEHSAVLRQEIDNLKRKVSEQEERHVAKIQALARENEVLKVQLKKYVGAVQMLKREGQTAEVVPNLWNIDGEVTVPEQKPVEVSEELASSYERKLIEVAEMHGELIEFNERLHRALIAKEALVSQMRQELIDLRGPVPGDLSQTSEDQSLSDFEISNRALINVWIPSVFLRGKAANAFHVYQVYIRIKDDEWNVYRRYTEFRSLHHKLQNKYPQVRAYSFPPKKAIGNKDAKFVEERRKQLQNYLRNVMNKIIQAVPEFAASPKKETLIQLMPFFIDITPPGEPLSKNSRTRVASRFPKLSRNHPREPRNVEPQSGDL